MKKLASIFALSVATFSYNANALAAPNDGVRDLEYYTHRLSTAMKASAGIVNRENDLQSVVSTAHAQLQVMDALNSALTDVASAAQEAMQSSPSQQPSIPPSTTIIVNGVPVQPPMFPNLAVSPDLMDKFVNGLNRVRGIVGTSTMGGGMMMPPPPPQGPLDMLASAIPSAVGYLQIYAGANSDVQSFVDKLNAIQQLQWQVRNEVPQFPAPMGSMGGPMGPMMGGSQPLLNMTGRSYNFTPVNGGVDGNGQPIGLPPVNVTIPVVDYVEAQPPYSIQDLGSAQRVLQAATQSLSDLQAKKTEVTNGLQVLADAITQLSTQKAPLVAAVQARLSEFDNYVKSTAGLTS